MGGPHVNYTMFREYLLAQGINTKADLNALYLNT